MLMKHHHEGPALESAESQQDAVAETLSGLLATFRRQSRLIGAACALGLMGGVLYIAIAPKKYTATASVFIDFLHPTNLSMSQGAPMSMGLVDPAAVESQIHVLKSERMALRAIRRLDLMKHPDLVLYRNPVLTPVRQFGATLGLLSPETPYQVERSVVAAVMDNTIVQRAEKSQQTFLIEVSYNAQDPDLAARISNAIVSAYLTDQLEARFEMAKLANEWFNDRLVEMRESVADAERAAQKFKAENNINTVTGNLVDEQSLAQSQRILVTARAALADARARLDRLDQIIAAGNVQMAVPEALSSPVIQRLRNEYSDLKGREAELRQRGVAEQHSTIAQVRASIAQTERLILGEFERIRASTENEVKTTEARVTGLMQEKTSAISSLTITKEKLIHAAELDREATAVRALYESFMNKFQVTTQEQSYPVSEARMITSAQPPIKESRRKGVILVLGSMLGLILGLGAAWLRENVFARIRTGAELEAATGIHFLGNLPSLQFRRSGGIKPDQAANELGKKRLEAVWQVLNQSFSVIGSKRKSPNGTMRDATTSKRRVQGPSAVAEEEEQSFDAVDPILRYVVDEPFSRFAETMRSCKVSLQQVPRGETISLVGIASAMPKEGKSTFASNFAQHLVSGGYRTLLIDGDLRNPSLSRAYGRRHAMGLIHILSGQATFADVIVSDPEARLTFVPAGIQKAMPNSEELLSSAVCREFFASVRDQFDFVVVDLPPLLSVVDGRVVAEHLDGLFFIAEWGRAEPRMIRQALRTFRPLHGRMIGCVLNKVPQQEMRPYESYY